MRAESWIPNIVGGIYAGIMLLVIPACCITFERTARINWQTFRNSTSARAIVTRCKCERFSYAHNRCTA